MSNAHTTILDHVEGIVVPGDVWHEAANEYWALLCLWSGLEFICRQFEKCEQVVVSRLDPSLKVSMALNAPGLEGIPKSLLTCSFHWYAVTACNYVRTVGAIAHQQDPSRPRPLDYVNAVLPDVLAFRDKVAAHFAWTSKNSKDNDAERMASVMPPLSFSIDAFYVGNMTLHVKRGGEESTSKSITPWSITKTHAMLSKRYWPSS